MNSKEILESFQLTIFFKIENFAITWAGYSDAVICHDRKLKKVQPLDKFSVDYNKKELG